MHTPTFESWRALLTGDLAAGQRVVLPVLSGSMMPLLPPGSEVEISASDGRGLAPGQVAVFRDGKGLTAHRVLLALPWPGGALLYQKGDANPQGGWVRHGRVVGVVVSVTRPDGTRLDLDTGQARRDARQALWRSWRRDLRERLRWRRLAQPSPWQENVADGPADCPGSLITLDAVPVPADGVLLLGGGGSRELLRAQDGALLEVSGLGPYIWRQFDGRQTLGEIVERVVSEYHVSPQAATGDLLSFVQALVARQLARLDLSAKPPAS